MDDRGERFEALFTIHYPAVLRYCARRVPEGHADDAASSAFAIAWRKLDDVPRDDPLPWLLAVARRVVANQARAHRRRLALGERLRARLPPAAAPADDGEAVRAALRRLRRADAEVLMLVHWEGLTAVQAAQVLGASPAAVRQRLHRARERLAAELDPPHARRSERAVPELEGSVG